MDEVVIIGYGSVQKEDATGSVELLNAEDFNKGAMVSADQLLTGKVAGVRITTNGGLLMPLQTLGLEEGLR